MLDVQYRMHPVIASFPSHRFYQGKLLTPDSMAGDRPLVQLPSVGKSLGAFCFVHVGSSEQANGMSKANPGEASCVEQLVRALKAGPDWQGGTALGVITPYSGQVQQIRNRLRGLGVDSARVQVSSVDAFQGSEREVIILSMVRSNLRGDIGFVSDWRRLNVAATRAKRLLVVVGNLVTLSNHSLWRDFFGFHRELEVLEWQGGFRSLSAEPKQLLAEARAAAAQKGMQRLPMRGDYPQDAKAPATPATQGVDYAAAARAARAARIAAEKAAAEKAAAAPKAPDAPAAADWAAAPAGWDAPADTGGWDGPADTGGWDAPAGDWDGADSGFDGAGPAERKLRKSEDGSLGLELETTRWGMRVELVEPGSRNVIEVGSTIVSIEGVSLVVQDSSDEELCKVEERFGASLSGSTVRVVVAPQDEQLLGWDQVPPDAEAFASEFGLITEFTAKGLLLYGPQEAIEATGRFAAPEMPLAPAGGSPAPVVESSAAAEPDLTGLMERLQRTHLTHKREEMEAYARERGLGLSELLLDEGLGEQVGLKPLEKKRFLKG